MDVDGPGRVRLEDEPHADGHGAGRVRDAVRPRRHDRAQRVTASRGPTPPPRGRRPAPRPPCTRGRSGRPPSRTARTGSSARARARRTGLPSARGPSHGRVASGSVGPNTTTDGVPAALARCARPESFPTKRRADARTPSASGSVVFPLRSKTRAFCASDAASALTPFSPALPRRTTESPRDGEAVEDLGEAREIPALGGVREGRDVRRDERPGERRPRRGGRARTPGPLSTRPRRRPAPREAARPRRPRGAGASRPGARRPRGRGGAPA